MLQWAVLNIETYGDMVNYVSPKLYAIISKVLRTLFLCSVAVLYIAPEAHSAGIKQIYEQVVKCLLDYLSTRLFVAGVINPSPYKLLMNS